MGFIVLISPKSWDLRADTGYENVWGIKFAYKTGKLIFLNDAIAFNSFNVHRISTFLIFPSSNWRGTIRYRVIYEIVKFYGGFTLKNCKNSIIKCRWSLKFKNFMKIHDFKLKTRSKPITKVEWGLKIQKICLMEYFKVPKPTSF